MNERYQGVVTFLDNASTNTSVQVWCGSHQLDLVMGNIFIIDLKYQFYSFTTGFILYLGRQAKLIANMDTIFPRFSIVGCDIQVEEVVQSASCGA